MKKNIGSTDKMIRLLLGLCFLALWGFKFATGTAALVLLCLSAALLVTTLLDYCPLYGLLGINSCEREKR